MVAGEVQEWLPFAARPRCLPIALKIVRWSPAFPGLGSSCLSSGSEACCLDSCSVGLFFGAENDFCDVSWEAEISSKYNVKSNIFFFFKVVIHVWSCLEVMIQITPESLA